MNDDLSIQSSILVDFESVKKTANNRCSAMV